MRRTRRLVISSATASAALVAMTAAPALGHECVNVSKPAGAGVQVIIGPSDDIVWATQGVWNRIAKGLIDPETGAGFQGLVGFEVDGDGKADFSTYIVTPASEIPRHAQDNGAECHGIVNVEAAFACWGG